MPSTDLVQDARWLYQWSTSSLDNFLLTIASVVFAFHVIPFLANTAAINIPGPFLAKFSDYWIMRQAMRGKRFEAVHQMHKKYGESLTEGFRWEVRS